MRLVRSAAVLVPRVRVRSWAAAPPLRRVPEGNAGALPGCTQRRPHLWGLLRRAHRLRQPLRLLREGFCSMPV